MLKYSVLQILFRLEVYTMFIFLEITLKLSFVSCKIPYIFFCFFCVRLKKQNRTVANMYSDNCYCAAKIYTCFTEENGAMHLFRTINSGLNGSFDVSMGNPHQNHIQRPANRKIDSSSNLGIESVCH